MKTIQVSLILTFTLLASIAIAQSSVNGKTSFAILGGVNFQNLNRENDSGDKLENDLIVGYHFGVNAQVPVAPEFYFQPGVQFSTKGAKNKEDAITSTYKLSYIELPLNFVYKGQLGNGYFMVGFGPYVAYGVGGKAKYEGGSVTAESDIKFKNEVVSGDPLTTVYIKPFDAGGNIFFGYEIAGGLFLQLNAQLGMINIQPDHYLNPDDSSTLKNTGYGLSLGYRF
ncbi:MAG TPA: PorT family protein [Prolixibacteraceae bacterium]|nr:PorT family protein [Prolixibacteraceae bacterium]